MSTVFTFGFVASLVICLLAIVFIATSQVAIDGQDIKVLGLLFLIASILGGASHLSAKRRENYKTDTFYYMIRSSGIDYTLERCVDVPFDRDLCKNTKKISLETLRKTFPFLSVENKEVSKYRFEPTRFGDDYYLRINLYLNDYVIESRIISMDKVEQCLLND